MGVLKKLFLCFLAQIPLVAFAQFDPQRTQYMYVPTAINPGAIAEGDLVNIYGNYRLQWAGFSGAPTDVFVSADLPITISGTKHGIGVCFQDESVGLFENQAFYLQYAYHFRFLQGNIGLGLSLGAISQNFDYESADVTGNGSDPVDGDSYHSSSDPLVPSSDQNKMAFDADFGAFYSDGTFNVGVSVRHLIKPSFDFADADKIEIPRIFYFQTGYDWEVNGQNGLHLKPSFLLRSDFSSSTQADFSCLAEFNKKFSGGLAYRWGDSFDFLLGAYVLNNLFLGYSYDLPFTGMIKSGGSHEFCLRYSFKLESAKKNKYKSERIL